ncbi:MAG: regulatory protein RecX [Candidatus Thiodiazotropha sp.]
MRTKLLQRGHDPELIEQVLDDLQAASLQSDARYAQQFVESRVTRGQGPVRIRMELRERGVEDALVREAMAPYDDEWAELLTGVHDAKYGPERTGDYKESARRARFLESRGFPGDLVRRFLFD